ncbi:hypothetical protein GS461_18310 [Rhodococcus hoagii]|nr:hypothetical protein [Prescottella equi]
MSAPDALDALDDVLEALPQIDGFGPWRQVGPREHTDSSGLTPPRTSRSPRPATRRRSNTSSRYPPIPPPCSTTAPPRTARTTRAVDQQNGVL